MNASRFPVVSIWRANPVDANGGIPYLWRPEAALIVRPFLDVDVVSLPAGGHASMNALLGGWTIGTAALSAGDDDPEFDLEVNLTILAETNVVIAFHRHTDDVEIGHVTARTTPLAPRRLPR